MQNSIVAEEKYIFLDHFCSFRILNLVVCNYTELFSSKSCISDRATGKGMTLATRNEQLEPYFGVCNTPFTLANVRISNLILLKKFLTKNLNRNSNTFVRSCNKLLVQFRG